MYYFLQVVKKSGVVYSNAGNMTTLTRNISALLELSFKEEGISNITAETSGNVAVQVFT